METSSSNDPRRDLASVSVLLEHDRIKALLAGHPRPLVLAALRGALDAYRAELQPGDQAPDTDAIARRVEAHFADAERDRIRQVVNATGILLHTGLGRAVVPQEAVDALAQLNGCCNLQIDLGTGLRGKRNYMTEQLLCRLTGAEAAMVVNNNAAATMLMLSALCAGKEVVVSRGQLIEIGGSYRLPDCIHQSGAIMVEVGTTNKTHLRDYEHALTDHTAALLHVNPSNYRVIGFTKSVTIEELVTLKQKNPELLVIDDLGCGALIDLARYGLPHEPTAPDSVAAGADLVCFSGDKLIGGPQAGIIVGRKDLIARIKKHPLTRMLRVGKMTDLALEQTLRLFLEPDTLTEKIPTLRMLAMPLAVAKRKAQAVVRKLKAEGSSLDVKVIDTSSEMGGGSLPGVPIPSCGVAVTLSGLSPEEICRRLRRHDPPVIARIKEDAVVLDMRTVLDGEERTIVDAIGSLSKVLS